MMPNSTGGRYHVEYDLALAKKTAKHSQNVRFLLVQPSENQIHIEDDLVLAKRQTSRIQDMA